MSGDGRDPQTLAEETLRRHSYCEPPVCVTVVVARWGLDEHAARVAAEAEAGTLREGYEFQRDGWIRQKEISDIATDRLVAERVAAERENARLRAQVAAVRALADYWQTGGDPACICGHSLGEHNSLGCYARLSYSPLVTCPCTFTDDRTHGLIAAEELRRALADVSTADGTEVQS